MTGGYVHLLLASLLGGIGFGLFFPRWNALVAERAFESKRDVAFSLSFFVSTATTTVTSIPRNPT